MTTNSRNGAADPAWVIAERSTASSEGAGGGVLPKANEGAREADCDALRALYGDFGEGA